MSSTDPNSRFISESSIEEARKEREEAWKKAYEAGTAPTPAPNTDYDPRTLYERLQEQRSKKEDAYAESRRFANQIRKLDTDEIEFLDTVDELERKKQNEQKQSELLALAEFNSKVAERHKRPANTSIKRHNPKSNTSLKSTAVASKLTGVVRRRRSSGDSNQPITESATSDKDASNTCTPQSDDDNGKEDRKKRRKESQNTDCSDTATAEPNLLNMLASYASDESE
ncbi:hypothetical protein H4R20_000086 [Coemansia guatemalensis]|uniref:FAM192A/Fyv6 N-terminal domain-containing protein n=1 Tax=Coemansia guatemalensis TaxID=2761395 RepID=A0A9W8LWY7_9FUNG|nr:hypothetical protein H4R20_000086 [Coemansia guatemalensis]